jgi:hypothetical protein
LNQGKNWEVDSFQASYHEEKESIEIESFQDEKEWILFLLTPFMSWIITWAFTLLEYFKITPFPPRIKIMR